MQKQKYFLLVIFPLIALTLLVSPVKAHANQFTDIVTGVKEFVDSGVNKVKDIFKEDKNIKDKKLSIESDVSLITEGDRNNDSAIDAGDTVIFTYTIINTTDEDVSFASLDTKVNNDSVHAVTNVKGVTAVDTKSDTITFPYITIESHGKRTISFEASINYYQQDTDITTEAELFSKDEKSLVKGQVKKIKAKKLTKEATENLVKTGSLQKISNEENSL